MEKLHTGRLFVCGVGAAIAARLGDLAVPVCLMLAAQAMDFVTGWIAAPYRGQAHSSQMFYRGVVKKVMMWSFIAVGIGVDILLRYSSGLLGIQGIPPLFGAFSILWNCCNEGISILENIRDTGTQTPAFLQKLIELLRLTTEEQADPTQQSKE